MPTIAEQYNGLEIAIIGMAGRFPGARTIAKFWNNIRDGIHSIITFSDQELRASEDVPDAELSNPDYVKARGMLEDIEYFDASFFGYSPREAEIMDPQHRFFLEVANESLEHAGYNPDTYDGLIGVYAGASMNSYLLTNLLSHPDLIASIGGLQLVIGNDKDHLTTRASYKLNLKGPSLNINTSCSTSLVAVHFACRSLLSGECDIALAGGVSISVPQKAGYLYQEGGITSPDGRCRAFDANAQGTVPGSGVGIVVLKRLEDALNDGDCIHALIKGSAINNDGALKVGYTAPGMDGQARVIRAAHLVAEVEPETITYIETHGTGTPLGDPIEVAALTQAFQGVSKTGFCALGSVKTNVGHLDAAAGVAGLIKTVEALKHGKLPPHLHFKTPNPEIDFHNSPFYVNNALKEWKADTFPRRAGVSSFGIGGTNAHIILQEAPLAESSGKTRSNHLILLSAKTPSALAALTTQMATHLEQHPNLNLADLAYTSQIGRKAFRYRRMLVCHNQDDALQILRTLPAGRVFTYEHETSKRPLTFMFPGQGSQYIHTATETYREEPVFREIIDYCSTLLKPFLGLDLRQILYPGKDQRERASQQLGQTHITQPAQFVIEYALARLWMQWGIVPQAMIGHSIGEYVAACLAGVFSLDDALALVAKRGQMMQQLPEGAMLNVPLPEETVLPLLSKKLSLAAVNGTSLCVVAGPIDEIEQLSRVLTKKGGACQRLHTSHAFHSQMMDPIVKNLAQLVARIPLKAPLIPYISNVTGTWITAAEATDPEYWGRHLRQTVRFATGIQTLCQESEQILLEVGPGRTLSTLARPYLSPTTEQLTLSSLPHPQDQVSDSEFLLTTLGKLWLAGIAVNWPDLYTHERRHRVPLPTYPFERQRYWIEPRKRAQQTGEQQAGVHASSGIEGQTETAFTLHLRPNLLGDYIAPCNEIERTIVDIWQELLGIEQIGVYDNFFDLGGHSLLATQLMSRLYDTFQVQVQFRSLFEKPTIAELATAILEIMVEQVDDALLTELEQLSLDEVQQTLASE